MLEDSTLFYELKSAGQLPSPTGVGLQILKLAQGEETTVDEIAKLLQGDPALSGRILKLANSAQSGSESPIASLPEAVVRLGLRTVCSVALGFSVVSNSRSGPCKQFDYTRFWSMSLARAVCAKVFSESIGKLAPSEAFTLGLLSSIGSLALSSAYPTRFGELVAAETGLSEREQLQKEQEAFSTNYCSLGAALLDDWGLPERFSETVLMQLEAPEEAGSETVSKLIRLLTCARKFSEICTGDEEHHNESLESLEEAVQTLGIDASSMEELCGTALEEWQEWGKILNVQTQAEVLFAQREHEQKLSGLFSREKEETGLPSGASDSQVSLRIVVADGLKTVRDSLNGILTEAGHSTLSVSSGKEALAVALEANPELVIMDAELEDLPGSQLCRSLRQNQMGRQMYLIVMTSNSDEELIAQTLDSGADDCVVKPVSPRLLMARIQAASRIIQLQREVAEDEEEIRRNSEELALLNRKLERAALTDALTELPNRRYLINRLTQEWALSERNGTPLSCMIIDIDHFKQVNDTHGHDIGDKVLVEVATRMQSILRKSDVICRFGGEEFVIVSPSSNLDAAKKAAERVRLTIAESAVEVAEDQSIPVTVSIGVNERRAGTTDVDSLLKAADEALYRAKQSGRNQVQASPVATTEEISPTDVSQTTSTP